ncbi:MAG: hypothetical protein KatS3mg076_3118 [Candidatus Binatia bacterium]|nr:MAG: hypothetical protein KatS3mg076_3118 [Candidatus Binatia bacterium]
MAAKEAKGYAGPRLADLVRGPKGPEQLLSVRLPVELIDRVDRVCDILGAGKSEVVTALLNEGLVRYDARVQRRGSVQRRAKTKASRKHR